MNTQTPQRPSSYQELAQRYNEIIDGHLTANGETGAHLSRRTGIPLARLDAISESPDVMSIPELGIIATALGVLPSELLSGMEAS